MKKGTLLPIKKTQHIALMGMLFALAMAFSYLESLVFIPGLIPGIKLGFSNIITMYCLFFLDCKSAYTLTILKAVFTFITRGSTAAMLSLAGGIFSVTTLLLLSSIRKDKINYRFLSICGAIAHNIGQLILARFLTNVFLYYYIPVLLISGIVVGILTGMVFKFMLPYIQACFKTRQ